MCCQPSLKEVGTKREELYLKGTQTHTDTHTHTHNLEDAVEAWWVFFKEDVVLFHYMYGYCSSVR